MADWTMVADDLTGAADTGVQFAKAGFVTVILLEPDDAMEADVLVGVTNTRSSPPGEAAGQVSRWANWLANRSAGNVYKKIDSTLRGNLGAELDAFMQVFAGRPAIVAPAFPAEGRVTIGGWQLLHGRPLEVTEIASDPVTPVRDSFVPRIIAGQTGRRVALLPLGPVAAGGEPLQEALSAELAAGTEIIVADASVDEDLARIVEAVQSLGSRVIWCGSAGLARHLIPAPAPGRLPAAPATGPVLSVIGSLSATSRRQVDFYLKTGGTALVTADPTLLAAGDEPAAAEQARVAEAVCSCLAAGKDTVLAVARTGVPEVTTGRPATARAVADGLGASVRQILRGGFAGGLVLTGGDTALGVCRQIGATAIRVDAELLPGIPQGRLLGGIREGLRVATKAGAFGQEETLFQISRLLKEGEREHESRPAAIAGANHGRSGRNRP